MNGRILADIDRDLARFDYSANVHSFLKPLVELAWPNIVRNAQNIDTTIQSARGSGESVEYNWVSFTLGL